MPRRILHVHLVLGVMLTALGILLVDRPVAEFVRTAGIEGAWLFERGTWLLDLVFFKERKFLLGGVLLIAGAGLALQARTRAAGRTLLYVADVQLLATLLTGVSKNVFERLRPYQVLDGGPGDATWFVDGGGSFPSGHTGFYFGLFLPLAWRFPRWRWPLLVAPWFIALARIDGNDHWVSDVAASVAITAALAWALLPIAGKVAAPPPQG
jgi:membrane-associated phospholipid phosphatase